MKKQWKMPTLEVLDISMTMNGPGNANADCFDVSDGLQETHTGRSNASCLDKDAIGS
ncbi:paeninodin family lasso peptide [Neobacillus sp. MM2021_6]|uniref:paeninodin family lasso peptide n=1 Tax=Bacillaceae TaxID=186817 RepID=UPI001408C14A|nr:MULTISPECIES: paeninodin family lasso peptide [Bacillaceae]MBO0962186.1 paeninodin family lasso peptide [Neobacillus sp. MM2021_6]NHC19034.1 paeninodin family lasso peptide [Bacillus sp. MM2020_4]